MGSDTLFLHRHKGIYYAEVTYDEVYPRELNYPVSEIPSDIDGYKAWLKDKRDFYDSEAERLKKHELEGSGDADEGEGYAGYPVKPSQISPYHGTLSNALWVYQVDLDSESFSINDCAHFRLKTIPRGDSDRKWFYYLTYDGWNKLCVRPDTPDEYVSYIYNAAPASKEGLACYRTFGHNIFRIRESVWMTPNAEDMPCSPGQVLASTIARGLMMHHRHHFDEACGLSPNQMSFPPMAEYLLRVAAPGGISLAADLHYVPYIGTWGRHFYGQDRPTVFYRFRGCIILLSANLDMKDYLKANLGLAVLHARESGAEKSTVILWSIRHVAVAIISCSAESLQVSCSDVYPVYDAYGIDEVGLSKGLGILAHYLRLHCTEGASLPAPASGKPSTVSHAVQEPQMLQDPSLPYDVIFHIMGFVDVKTYDAFQYVSKDLRKEWAAHPRISNYTVLSVASVNKQTNAHLPDVTLNVKVDNGPSKRLTLFYTLHSDHDEPFNPGEHYFSYATYPSPHVDKLARWKPVRLRIPFSIKDNEMDRYRAFGDYAPLSYYKELYTGLFMLEEELVPLRAAMDARSQI